MWILINRHERKITRKTGSLCINAKNHEKLRLHTNWLNKSDKDGEIRECFGWHYFESRRPFPDHEDITRLQGGDEVLVDVFKGRKEHDVTAITKEVMGLAQVLSKIDPLAFGLFKCRGGVSDVSGCRSPHLRVCLRNSGGHVRAPIAS